MNRLEKIVLQSYISGSLHKICDAEVLWTKNEKFKMDEFAYAIANTPRFSNVKFDVSDSIEVKFERYGGSGIGYNGGGSRVANYQQYQLKGIGVNMLVGGDAPEHHAYGGLDVLCAVNEIILTHLINKITPIGAINIHGLILVDKQVGRYHDGRQCWSVILVRDQTLRPAHLLHAVGFKEADEKSWRYGTEEARVKYAYKAIEKDIGTNPFVQLVGKFLMACANQFAFARMAKVLHGAITDSNLSLDGKWLDLPLVSIVPGGSNWSHQSDFYSEPFEVMKFIAQCMYNYSKYNKKSLNPQILFSYYSEQFSVYKKLHATFLLGIDSELTGNIIDCQCLTDFEKIMDSLIVSDNKEAIKHYPKVDHFDPVEKEILSMWQDIMLSDEESNYRSKLTAHFMGIVHLLSLSDSNKMIWLCIQSIKRISAARFLYFSHTNDSIEKYFFKDDINQCHDYINERIELIDWLYEKSHDTATIFKSKSIHFYYDMKNNVYHINGSEFNSLKDILDRKMIEPNMQAFVLHGFDFRFYIKSLLDLISKE